MIGTRRRVTQQIPTLCCKGQLFVGDVVEIEQQTSKNRVIVKVPLVDSVQAHGYHKVKLSTLRRCSEEVVK